MSSPVCLYVDNSNIFHEGQRYAEERMSEDRYGFRIHFAHFLFLAARGRKFSEVVWGGSIPPPSDDVWQHLDNRGVNPILIPRSSSGENETVDHAIQLQMYRHIRKYRDMPGTIVLCTGDGKGYRNNEGFLYDLEGFLDDGWGIELLSWTHSCHGKLKQLAETKGKFIPLEHFYESITFIKDGRRVKLVDIGLLNSL